MVIRMYLFGRFEARCDRRQLKGLGARKTQEFLSYMLLEKQRPIQRERLADQLWEHVDSRCSKKYLRQALWEVQRAYDLATGAESSPLLQVDQEWIRIDAQAAVWVDALELERAYAGAVEAPAGALEPDLRDRLRTAVGLYRGELLEGWYHEWCEFHRDNHRSMYLWLINRLMIDAEATGHWEAGLAHGRRALREDRANERTHALMMRLHRLAGDRTAALRQFELCEAALREDLDVAPQDSTRRLYEQIRDSADPASPAGGVRVPLARLRELGRSLSELQEEVAGYIRALECL
jgi:DNA-binding SARP family transcriptional activator